MRACNAWGGQVGTRSERVAEEGSAWSSCFAPTASVTLSSSVSHGGCVRAKLRADLTPLCLYGFAAYS